MNGKIVITTQPADQSAEMLHLLREHGAIAYSLPMIETRTLVLPDKYVQTLTKSGACDLLIFTSKKGVKGFFENVLRVNGNYNLPEECKIAVVGKGTAAELEHYHQKATYINPGNNAKDMAAYLMGKINKPIQKIVLALGNKAPVFLEEILSGLATVNRIDVYETICLKPAKDHAADLIRKKQTDMCIFTSPSGFFSFVDAFKNIKGLNLAAIGNTTASAIEESGFEVVVISPEPSALAMINALSDFFKKQQ